MKLLPIATALLVSSLSMGAALAADMPAGMKMPHEASSPPAKHGKTTGHVTEVDPSRSSVTIAHQAVSSLGWPAMTMTFKATPKQLKGIATGDRVEFEFDQRNDANVITRISKTR